MDGARATQDAVLECVCEFFTRHGTRLSDDEAKLDSGTWISDGSLGVAVATPARAADRTWIAVADSAPRACAGWVEALAKHCHARLGADVFWYWTAPKKLGVAESGWVTAGPEPKNARTWSKVHAAVASFARPYFAWTDGEDALRARFSISKDAFLHDLEFAPPAPAKATAKPAATKATKAAKSADGGMAWFAAAEKRVRPTGVEGPAPRAPTAAALASIYADATAHFDYRLTMFPTLPPDPDGLQAEAVAGWRCGDPGADTTPDAEAISLVLLSRMLYEANKRPEQAIATLIDRLASSRGPVAAAEILVRAHDLENAAAGDAPDWWILGRISSPVGASCEAWFALRRWVGHADAEAARRALAVVTAHADPLLQCAAAPAFPTQTSLWRPHLGALSVRGVPSNSPAHRRLTSLVACAPDLASATELFAAYAEVANSEEYPTLARALGPDGLALIAAQQPTDVEAIKARALALATYVSPLAAAELKQAGTRAKAVQKIVDDFFVRHPTLAG